MPNYLCILRTRTQQPRKGEGPSPTEMQEMYARFREWQARFDKNIVDMGGKLGPAGKVVTTDGTRDGPFVEAKELVGGFMVLRAEALDEAVEIARMCPGVVSPGSSLEVREIATP